MQIIKKIQISSKTAVVLEKNKMDEKKQLVTSESA